MGTPSGLYKYDGNLFIAVPIKADTPAINIHSFYKDNAGDVWISTSYGIFIYDAEKKVIEPPIENQPWVVTETVYQQNDSIYWIGLSYGELIRYNKQANTYRRFQFPGKSRLEVVIPINKNTLFLGFQMGGGSLHFDINTCQTIYSETDVYFSNVTIQLGFITEKKRI